MSTDDLAAGLERALKLAEEGRLDEAIREWTRVLDSDPTCAHAHYYLGVARAHQGWSREAIEHWQAAIEHEPDLGPARFNLGHACIEAGDLSGAVEHLRVAFGADPSYSERLRELGVALSQEGRRSEAILLARAQAELEPMDPTHPYNLGILHNDLAQFDEALRYFRRTVELAPKFGWALTNLAGRLLQKGEHEEARQHFAQALEIDPADRQALSGLAEIAEIAGRATEAIELYRQAHELDPSDPVILFALARLARQRGDELEFEEVYDRLLRLEPSELRSLTNLGAMLHELGELEAARDRLEAALRIDPSSLYPRIDLSIVLRELGHIDEAIQLCEEFLEASPPSAGLHYNLGAALSAHPTRRHEAGAHYAAAIDLAPDYALAHAGLGSRLRGEGRLDEAELCFRLALHYEPALADAHYELGLVFGGTERIPMATAHFHRALFLHRAAIKRKHGLSSEALAGLATTFAVSIDAPFAALAAMSSLPLEQLTETGFDLQRQIAERCEAGEAVMRVLDADETLSDSERERWKGIWLFFLGDLPGALEALSASRRAHGGGLGSPAVAYYLLQAAQGMLSPDAEALRSEALELARALAASLGHTAEDLYYTALLLFESEDPADLEPAARSADACVTAASDDLAARYLQVSCARRLKRTEAARAALDGLLACEVRAVSGGRPFLLSGAPVTVGVSLSSWRSGIERRAREHELAGVVSEVADWLASLDFEPQNAKLAFASLRDLPHFSTLLCMESELRAFVSSESGRAAELEWQKIRAEHPLLVDELERGLSLGQNLESWLGARIERAISTPTDLPRERALVRYGLLRSYLEPRSALVLNFYSYLVAERPVSEVRAKAKRAALLTVLTNLVAYPLAGPVASVFCSMLIVPTLTYVNERFPASTARPSYEDFRLGVLEWLSTARGELGGDEFERRYAVVLGSVSSTEPARAPVPSERAR